MMYVAYPSVELPNEVTMLLLVRRARGVDGTMYCKLELQDWPANEAYLPDPESPEWIEYIPEPSCV